MSLHNIKMDLLRRCGLYSAGSEVSSGQLL